jgi:hypothetical protein
MPEVAVVEAESGRRIGRAWVGMWLALAVHVTDEALTGFLRVYNPTVAWLRAWLGFWPMPTFTFGVWLGGLILFIAVLAALSPFAFRNAVWIRPLLFVLAIVVGLLNAAGHIAGTIFGQTVSSVRFSRPAPGFWSSPVLIAAAVYALVQLRRTRDRPTNVM